MSTDALPSLDAGEQAYFESGGETPVDENPQPGGKEGGQEQGQSQDEQQPEQKEQPKEQKQVPLAALHEERQRNRQMREEMNQLREQTRVGNERLQQLIQAAQRPQQPQIPDLNDNPAANLHTRLQGMETLAQQLQQERQQQWQLQQQEQARQQAISQLTQDLNQQEAEYRQVTPDYDKALEFLKTQEESSLQAMGYDPHSIQQILQNKFMGLAFELRQGGHNVPDKVYALAKARGYAQNAGLTPQQKMQNTQKGVAAAKSLGSGGGTSNALSLEALAAMPADEFAELTKDEKAWRKLMGG